MIRTSRRLAVTGALAVLLLSGCGNGELRPGAAALVGPERITTAVLQTATEKGLADPQAAQELGADRPGYQRQVLGRLVKREVLRVAAVKQGVSVTDGDVAALLDEFVKSAGSRQALDEQAAQNGVAATDVNRFVRDIVTERAVGDALVKDVDVPAVRLQALYQQNIAQFDQVRSRHILVPDEKTARTILANVRQDPSRFAALAAQFSTDTTNKDRGGDLGVAPRGQFVPAFDKVVFSLPNGGYGLAKTEFGWHVINTIERVTTSLAAATPQLRRVELQGEIAQRTLLLLTQTARELGVTINPRFGRWNPETVTVEAAPDPSGVLVAPSQAPPADPNAPPADPNAPPADPNAPPADPGAPPPTG